MSDTSWEVEIEKIKGDIKLINQSLDTIKNNHLFHIEKSIASINKVLWTVGLMVFGQLAIVLRDFIF